MNVTGANQSAKRVRKPRLKGIVQAAALLGVSRNHLYLTLRGERRSPRLLRRYAALRNARNQEAGKP